MRRAVIALAATMIALTATAPSAKATATRAEYVAQVDPICQAADLKGKRLAKKHRLPRVIELGELLGGDRDSQLTVARQLALNNRKILPPFIASISTIPPPLGDEGTIAKWIADQRLFERNTDKAVRAIRRGKPRRGYRLILASLRPVLEDYEALEPWGFQYCTT
jgi:hypothetical protein